jgi:lysophospholipase L1-like esterase
MTSLLLRFAVASAAALSIVAGAGVGALADPGEESGAAGAVPVRILPLGDSITYGLGSLRHGSYRVELAHRLRAAGVAVDMVGSNRSGPAGADDDNEGHSGWRIDQVAERADEWMATYRPDVVLLHVGTNDMRSDEKAAGAAARLSALVDRLLAASPDVTVLVAEIVGARDDSLGGFYQHRIDAYNSRIPSIVAARGDRVRLVNQTGVDGTDLYDVLHPNEFGYRKMAWNWYRALRPVLDPYRTNWPMRDNPFTATKKLLRNASTGDAGRWWYLRPVTVTAGGRSVTTRRWQTRRTTVETYRVRVSGQGATPRYETRTRTVTRWSLV